MSKIETIKHSEEDLIKIIREVIMNSKIPEGDRQFKIYMGPKQWEMFNDAVQRHFNNEE